MYRLLLLCLLLVPLSSPVGANDLSRADSALMRGDYPAAIALLEALSDDGNSAAMVHLASLYHRGEGVERDTPKAVELYLAAAELGSPEAQFNLGNMYLLGEGLPQDEVWALSFYRMAAAQGHALAAQNMRELYRANGIDPNSDQIAAEDRAATAVVAEPAAVAPVAATEATAPDGDLPAAPAANAQAAAGSPAEPMPPSEPLGDTGAASTAATGTTEGDAPEQLRAHAPVRAPALSPAASADPAVEAPLARSTADASAEPASAAASVQGEPMVTLEPIETPVEAVAQTLPADQAEALRLAEAHGIEVDIGTQSASPPVTGAAQKPAPGDAQAADQAERLAGAKRMLALENYDHGITRLQELVDAGSGDAAWLLSGLYARGEGVGKDEQRAVQWRERAAKLGHAEAQFVLAERYSHGRGVAPDEAMAITYYRDAARSGHPQAREKLRAFYADAGLPMPEFTRPRTPIAMTATGATEPVDAGVVVQPVLRPDPIESTMAAEPAPASSGPSTAIAAAPAHDDDDSAALQDDDAHGDASPDAAAAAIGEADVDAPATPAPAPMPVDPASQGQQSRKAPVSAKTVPIAQPRLDPDAIVVHPDRVAGVPGVAEDPGPEAPANHEVIPGSVLAVATAVPVPEPAAVPDAVEFAVAEPGADNSVQAVAHDTLDSEPAPAAVATDGSAALAADVTTTTAAVVSSRDASASAPADTAIGAAGADAAGTEVVTAAGAAVATAATELAATSAVTATTNESAEATGGGLFRRLTGLFRRETPPEAQPAVATTSPVTPGADGAAAAATSRPVPAPEIVEQSADPLTDREPVVVSALSDDPLPVTVMADDFTAPDTMNEMAGAAIGAGAATDEFTPAAPQSTVADGKRALAAGDFDVAARIFTRLGELGDPEAQAHIGYLYYVGEGVEPDLARAVDWYRRAAVQGNRDAQYNLAVAYAFGEGVDQDDSEAVTWYRRAAEQGSAIAQYSLGMSYALGEGVEQNDAAAITWYRAAAEQGYAAAQYNLGYSYRTGHGIEADEAEALRWFEAAATNGHASAQYSLGYMYRSGRGVERNVDEAIRWYRLAAAQGHPDARADLASLNPGG